MEIKRDILWRVYLCFIGMVVLAFLVIGKALYIQQVEGSYWRSKSDSLHTRIINLDADRGTIYSEDGSMLSTSIPYFNIYIDFGAEGLRDKNGKRFRENLDSLSYALAKLFQDKSSNSYKQLLQEGYRKKDRYFSLKKNIDFQQYQQLRNFPLVRLGRNKSGFIAEVKSKRLNPFGMLANRTIGLARENAQNVGLERTYDSLLKGETGKKLVRFIAGGVAVPVEGYEVEPENGKDLITTLDVNIQDIAQNALLKMMIQNEAVTGTCIVMEVATGKIKAIANLGKSGSGEYWEDLNYAIRASEPGSTFKLATMLAVLEDGKANLGTQVNLENGVWQVNRRTVYDSERHKRTNVSLQQAFELSSNVGMAKIVMQHYSGNPNSYLSHLKRLRLNEVSGIDLVGETQPIIKSPKSKTWSATSLPWMSFGYEVLVSPLQTLMLYNAVANNGKMMRPYLVQEVQKDGRTIWSREPEILVESICKETTLRQLKTCLEGVMLNGTGKSLSSPYFSIAGKTGTALVANGNRGYADHIYQSSFAGYFPADNPKYSCIVVIKNKPFAPVYYGGSVAGPVFREIADKLFAIHAQQTPVGTAQLPARDSSVYRYAGNSENVRKVMEELRIPFTDSAGKKYQATVEPDASYQAVLKGAPAAGKMQMPELKGLGLRDALFLLEERRLKVQVKGKGKVKSQSVPPGQTIEPKQTIILELN
ncbi:penicillin-binding protein [Flavihumibacter sp. CACIAM 22H1]|uniref:penicillin-binding protein n=1 Tax=Flavihumibacter sp. CACIAM 22H1 TaxID=1812911 RepID=UPI0007A82270|nr:penicillin-binding protein [Flavihumibacter sp. CACIAM 22H1]KYP16515.1 MAG: peptidoglycan glycosyltransferase [Flavihumibacter sp. CACIAM 22H1]